MSPKWLLLAGLCLAMDDSVAADLPPPPKAGEVPPQLLGKDRHGRIIDLADYRGKLTIVTFWRPGAGPAARSCRFWPTSSRWWAAMRSR